MRSALIIANTEYTDPGLAQLTAPGKDAEDFARVLKDQDICAFNDVNILLNEPEHIVRGAIEELFDQKKPDDLLILYFSGHGVRDELGALYLAVKNTNRFRLRSTAVKSDFIREAMDQSRSKRQVLILDCCNSGAFSQGTKAATGVSIGTASAFEAGYGRIILTASDSTQFAWEGNQVIGETDNSLFTHFLVKGLEGEADLDGDGSITVDELYDYAYERVRLATPKQTPSKFSSKQQGELVLRENIRTNNIEVGLFPTELDTAIKSSLAFMREGAVRELERLLHDENPELARSARHALERVEKEDQSHRVAQAATQALEAIRDSEQLAPQQAKDQHFAADKLELQQKAHEEEEKKHLSMQKVDTQQLVIEGTQEAEQNDKEDSKQLAARKADEKRLAREKVQAKRKTRNRNGTQVSRTASEALRPVHLREDLQRLAPYAKFGSTQLDNATENSIGRTPIKGEKILLVELGERHRFLQSIFLQASHFHQIIVTNHRLIVWDKKDELNSFEISSEGLIGASFGRRNGPHLLISLNTGKNITIGLIKDSQWNKIVTAIKKITT